MWMAINDPCYAPYVPLQTGILPEAGYCADVPAPCLDTSVWNLATELREGEIGEWGESLPVFGPWEVPVRARTAQNEADAMLSPDPGGYVAEKDCVNALDALDRIESLAPSDRRSGGGAGGAPAAPPSLPSPTGRPAP